MSDEMEDRQKDSIGPYMGSTIEEDLYNEDMMEKDPKTLKDRDMIVNSQATTEDEESQSQIPLVNKGKMKAQEVPNIGAIEVGSTSGRTLMTEDPKWVPDPANHELIARRLAALANLNITNTWRRGPITSQMILDIMEMDYAPFTMHNVLVFFSNWCCPVYKPAVKAIMEHPDVLLYPVPQPPGAEMEPRRRSRDRRKYKSLKELDAVLEQEKPDRGNEETGFRSGTRHRRENERELGPAATASANSNPGNIVESDVADKEMGAAESLPPTLDLDHMPQAIRTPPGRTCYGARQITSRKDDGLASDVDIEALQDEVRNQRRQIEDQAKQITLLQGQVTVQGEQLARLASAVSLLANTDKRKTKAQQKAKDDLKALNVALNGAEESDET